jgi:GNAT superfamily N-acetyltransferase
VFWELDPVALDRAKEAGDTAFEKESWVSATLLDWGSCGKVVYVDGVPAGFVMYAPPGYVPALDRLPHQPGQRRRGAAHDRHVHPDFAGGGLGRVLLQSVAKDLTRRGVRAIEAFGDEKWESPACVLPAEHLRGVGFKTVRPHHRFPRLRLELKSAVSWREDVEVALERLLGLDEPGPAAPSGLSSPG